jgi:hypothetical protein
MCSDVMLADYSRALSFSLKAVDFSPGHSTS